MTNGVKGHSQVKQGEETELAALFIFTRAASSKGNHAGIVRTGCRGTGETEAAGLLFSPVLWR